MISFSRFTRVLLDTGPLVAILNAKDNHHQRCTRTLSQIQPPLLTSWPVLTEAAWLLRNNGNAVRGLFQASSRGLLKLIDVSQEELGQIDKLYKRYREVSPQLADLTLVYYAQREELETVFTLDRRDFSIYRRKGKLPFRLLPEFD